MDGGAWWAAVHGVSGSRTRLSDFIFTFHFHALEKKMATHSSVFVWRIPGMGEPVGLPSLGSHRVGHDRRDLAAAAAFLKNYVLASLHSFCFSNTLPCFHLCAFLLLFFLHGFPCSWCDSSFCLFRSQVKCVSQSLFLTSLSHPVLTALTLSLCIPLPYIVCVLPDSPITS